MQTRPPHGSTLVMAAIVGLIASFDVLIWTVGSGNLREALATSRVVATAVVVGALCALLLLVSLLRWLYRSAFRMGLVAVGVLLLTPYVGYQWFRAYPSMPIRAVVVMAGTAIALLWIWVVITLAQDLLAERRGRGIALRRERQPAGPASSERRDAPGGPALGIAPGEQSTPRSGPSPAVMPHAAPAAPATPTPAGPPSGARRQLRWTGEDAPEERRRRGMDHAKARQSARQLMLRDDWLVIDTETTGLEEHDEVIGIAVIDPTGALVFASPIKSRMAIHPDATAAHGRVSTDLTDAPGFPEIWPRLRAILRGHTLVAYGATFDRRMLEQTARHYGLTPAAVRWRCAMNLYARFWGEPLLPHGYRSQKLAVACQRLGIPLEGHHAIDHCYATLALLQAMAEDEGLASR